MSSLTASLTLPVLETETLATNRPDDHTYVSNMDESSAAPMRGGVLPTTLDEGQWHSHHFTFIELQLLNVVKRG